MSANATQSLHEYASDTFAAAAHNAAVESKQFAAVDLTQPSRSSNNTQIFTKDISVSGTEQKVKGVVEAVSYQVNKKLTETAKDMELALMAGSRASGASGVGRQMAGVINALTTNATTRTSGSSLGETTFNDVMNMIWNSTDTIANEVYVGGTLKRDISGFTASNTRNMSADDKRLVRPVDVYETDFGVVKVFLHRNVPNGANAKMLVAINTDYEKLSWLRPTMVNDLGKRGDSIDKQLVGELTIEHRGQATGAAVGGFTG